MKLVDLTHPFSMHTPGWVNYPSPKISYIQRHATDGIVSQLLETPLHVGTHIDAEFHIVSGGRDVADLELGTLFGEGVVVDIADAMEDFATIKPEMLTDRADIRPGDILLYHTGWHRYFNGSGADEDEVRYFCRHPGGGREMAEWICDMKFAWTGFDCGSGDHPMNTSIRRVRPDIAAEFERSVGKGIDEVFPPEDLFVMHRLPFKAGIVHVENLGGDIDQVLGKRCKIGAFPWRFVGGEAAFCRVVAFIDDGGG